jgi:hypothetical protein
MWWSLSISLYFAHNSDLARILSTISHKYTVYTTLSIGGMRLLVTVLLLFGLCGCVVAQGGETGRKPRGSKGTDSNNKTNHTQHDGASAEPINKLNTRTTVGDISEHGTIIEKFLNKHFHKEDAGEHSIRATFAAAKDEFCDWTRSPISTLRGDICGKYYKVLDLKRIPGEAGSGEDANIEKRIKRAYRTKSLALHPDKNLERGASDAFKIVSEAYECLSDKACRNNYDSNIQVMERQIADWRQEVQLRIKKQIYFCVSEAHYYSSLFAQNFYQCKFYPCFLFVLLLSICRCTNIDIYLLRF